MIKIKAKVLNSNNNNEYITATINKIGTVYEDDGVIYFDGELCDLDTLEVDYSELIKECLFNPLIIGKMILEQAGYEVELNGFGYNSIEVIVKKGNKLVLLQVYGE